MANDVDSLLPLRVRQVPRNWTGFGTPHRRIQPQQAGIELLSRGTPDQLDFMLHVFVRFSRDYRKRRNRLFGGKTLVFGRFADDVRIGEEKELVAERVVQILAAHQKASP